MLKAKSKRKRSEAKHNKNSEGVILEDGRNTMNQRLARESSDTVRHTSEYISMRESLSTFFPYVDSCVSS